MSEVGILYIAVPGIEVRVSEEAFSFGSALHIVLFLRWRALIWALECLELPLRLPKKDCLASRLHWLFFP